MVLGLGSKKKTTVKVEFQIHIREIKPWKPTSGRNPPLVVQWERGENRSGKTKSAAAIQEDGGKVVFNDSFRLPAKLIRENEGKGKDVGVAKYQKKTIVFILQEAGTGLQMARCVMNVAEYGDADSTVSVSIPLAVGSKYATAGPKPTLFLSIGPAGKEERSFASRVSFSASTPRRSVSKVPEKLPSSSKSKVEPALDDDARRALVAALLISDDEDDNVSVESFTDDESTPEDLSLVAETPTPPKSSASATPSRAESAKSSSSRPESQLSVTKSSRETPADRSSSESSSPSNTSSTPAKDDPLKAIVSSDYMAEVNPESSRTISVKQSPEQKNPVPKPLPKDDDSESLRTFSVKRSPEQKNPVKKPPLKDDDPESTRTFPTKRGPEQTNPVPKTPLTEIPLEASVVQQFSSDSIPKPVTDSATAIKELESPNLRFPGNISTNVNERIPSLEKREGLLAALYSAESSSSPTKISMSSSNSELKTKDSEGSLPAQKTDSMKSLMTTSATSHTEEELPEKKSPEETSGSLSLSSATGGSTATASSTNLKKTIISIEDSSLEFSNDSFDDLLSEIGKSPTRTSLLDQPNGSTISESSLKASVGAQHSGIDEKSIVPGGDVQDSQKLSRGKTPDTKNAAAVEAERTGVVPMNERELEAEYERGGQETSVLASARANLAKVEKKALEELRNKIAKGEARLLAQTQMVSKLQGELRDTGAMEVALYSIVAEHGSSSHKLHTPARRLVRLYMHAYKHCSPEKRAGTAKNSVSGLVTVAKSCGTDVSRLCFWWSNVVALRSVITQAFDTTSSSTPQAGSINQTSGTNGNGGNGWARARRSMIRPSFVPKVEKPQTNWSEPSTYITALEKIEEWIYSKIVETLWWQAMIPRMQKSVDASAPTSPRGMSVLSPASLSEFTNKAKEDLSKLADDVSGIFVKKPSRRSTILTMPELGDARQGNVSVEVWKKAIMEALRRLCPVRGAGHDCGCLPILVRMALEGSIARLDVALFNAILREPNDDTPTDPLCDPVTDSSVLPISPGRLTFGGGSQLKNVVVTWSTFIAGLVNIKEPVFAPDGDNVDNTENSDDSEKLPKFFNLIKATGDLLMLPKDILMDRAIRKEICPMLSLPLIRRILVNFVPDEFAPDPISHSLLAALNAEASIEKQRLGEADDTVSSVPMAAAPPMTYVPPSAHYVWPWVGEATLNPAAWGYSSNSLLRKGYTSDEDLEVLDELQKSSASDGMEFLLVGSRKSSRIAPNGNGAEDSSLKSNQSADISVASRFQLLKEIWGIP